MRADRVVSLLFSCFSLVSAAEDEDLCGGGDRDLDRLVLLLLAAVSVVFFVLDLDDRDE